MRKPKYGHLQGSSAYLPYAARTKLRRRQRRSALLLRVGGALALCLAGALLVRQAVFHGGQPAPPSPIPVSPPAAATAEGAATPKPVVEVAIRPATTDVLASADTADSAAHASPAPQPTAGQAETQAVLPQYRALYEQNPDLVGWIKIDGTKIDYPVVQNPEDNEYYLRRGFDRLYATGGTLFLDNRCVPDGKNATANRLIYGHNMGDGSMFGQLVRYREEAFYLEHPTFRFDTLAGEGVWQVVAALDTSLGADALPYYSFFDAEDRATWQARVDAITALALYDTGVTPEYGVPLLTLSTCGTPRSGTDKRFAVLAVRIPSEGGNNE